MHIEAWLRSLGMERYVSAFEANDVDMEVLPDLTDDDLEKLGVTLGHRKKLLRAIRELGTSPERPSETPGEATGDDAPAEAGGDAVDEATGEDAPSPEWPSATAPVGREDEFAHLLARFARARAGDGQVVLLAGEAGLGKSHLVWALREGLRDTPHAALEHRCLPHRGNSPFSPLIDQLERTAGFTADDTSKRRRAKLESLVAGWSQAPDDAVATLATLLDLPAVTTASHLSPYQRRRRTHAALLAQLAAAAAARPVLVTYEDVQWMDPSSLEVLGRFVERVRSLSALIVITARPEFAPPWADRPHVTQLVLGRLGPGAGARLVKEVAGRPLPDEVAERIATQGHGVPLVVADLTRTVLQSGLVRDAGDRFELAGELGPLAIPATLEDSLRARLQPLTLGREIAEIAAVIGPEIPRDRLAAVARLPAGDLDAALARLVEAGIMVRRGAAAAAGWAFAHDLIRDVVYGDLADDRRRDLHHKVASALPRDVERHPELPARHYAEAGRADDAILYWQRAGHRAAARAADHEATTHFERALALIRAGPDSVERQRHELALLVALHGPLVAVRGHATSEVGDRLERAARLARGLGDGRQLGQVLYARYAYLLGRGEHRLARAVAEELVDLGEREGDPSALAVGRRSLGTALLIRGEPDAAAAHLEAALELSSRGGAGGYVARFNHVPAVNARVCLAWLRWCKGRPDEAGQLYGQAIREARRLGSAGSLAFALLFGGIVIEMLRRDRAPVPGFAAELLALAEQHGMAVWRAYATAAEGWALAERGDPDAGAERMHAGLDRLRATGYLHFRPFLLGLLAEIESRRGVTGTALKLLDEAVPLAEWAGERWLVADLWRVRGDVLLGAKARDEGTADTAYAEALAAARQTGVTSLELRAATALARRLRDQRRIEEARDLVGSLLPAFAEASEIPDLVEARALLDELDAENRRA